MAMKDDLADFLFHTAIKWNITRIDYPNTDRPNFFRREALNLNMLARKEVRTIVRSMLDYPKRADWTFDQHFQILVPGCKPSPDCHPIDENIQKRFDKGYIELEKQYGKERS